MFENPLRKYATGGVTSSQEQKLVQVFSKAASKLNIKPEVLIQKVQELTEEQQIGFIQAIQDIADSDNPKPESIQLIQSIFAQPSQAFRNGGKIHDFICKHAKGGKVDCGCKQEGGTFESKDKQVKIKNFGTAQADTTGSYSYPSTNGEFRFNPNGRTATVWDNTGGWPIHRYADQNWINRHPRRQMLPGFLGGHRELAPEGFFENLVERVENRTPQVKENGGNIEKAQRGRRINNKRKTITEVGRGLDEYDAKEMGIDPNTLVGTSSIITAYPNKKPYVVNGQVPFWTRNGLVFNLGGVESDYIEDGVRMGKGVPGRKYKVSSVLDQDGLLNFSYNENAKEFPMISRYASPKDTIYYLDFNDFDKNTLGYEEVRSMYNKAIDQPDTFALNREAYLELQRQKQERAPKKEKDGGVVENKKKDNEEPSNGTIKQGKPRSKVAQAIDNNPKARHFVEGAKKFVKSPMVKWPLAGAAAYGGWKLANVPFVQETGEIAPLLSKGLFPFLSQVRPKFLLDTMNPMKDTKAEKPSDVFWVAKEQSGGLIDYYKNKWSNDFFE